MAKGGLQKQPKGRTQVAAARWLALAAALIGLTLIWLGVRQRLEPSGEQVALQAYNKRISQIWVTVQGKALRILADDTEGTPHQRFVVVTSTGQTLLVAYNLNGRERIPLRAGDKLQVRGEYEWSREGGLIHNVHRRLSGRGPSGWVRLLRNGRKYD